MTAQIRDWCTGESEDGFIRRISESLSESMSSKAFPREANTACFGVFDVDDHYASVAPPLF